jgi:hypothetical protein
MCMCGRARAYVCYAYFYWLGDSQICRYFSRSLCAVLSSVKRLMPGDVSDGAWFVFVPDRL